MKRGTSNLLKEGTACEHCPLDSQCCGRLTDIVALHTNDSYCYFFSREGRNMGVGGGKLPENFRNHVYFILGKCPL